MIQYQILSGLLHFIVFFMGAAIGSFLNVVIYRLPLNISVNNPRRSFCPNCKYQIPMWHNIPIVSWLMLRGKCANCGQPISPRYIGVEVLTGVLFYAVFWHFSGGGDWRFAREWGLEVVCLWVLMSLLVAGTFIDIDHFILPHEITIGGTVAGLIAAFVAPGIIGEDDGWHGLAVSFASATLGLGGLWLVVELGKLAFGRKKFAFEKTEAWSVTQPNEEEPPVLALGDDTFGWGDLFMRKKDRMVITSPELRINDLTWQEVTAELWYDRIQVHGKGANLEEFNLEQVKRLEGTTTQVVIPREAMGFGDVLLLMMIGAFLGWKAVLFTILAASVFGTLFAGFWRLIGRTDWGAKIPFGPYLALGAVLWVFWGPQVVAWYWLKATGTRLAFL
jgi:leader peptidase (prepilin peptidase)/N-methyltransferase